MDESTLSKRLGVAVRNRRMALGFSQDTFADSIKMHRAYYSSIERGERNLTLATLQRVSDGLGTKSSELLADAGF